MIQKSTPDFNDLMRMVQNAIFSRLNCHGIGQIIEFNKENQTCTIQLMQLKEFNNNDYTPAPLTEVPLIIYGQRSGHITLPDPTGCICLVLFLDRNIDSFMQTGEMYAPKTARMHDFSDCVAITTFNSLATPIQNYDDTAISIIYTKTVEDIAFNAVIKNFADTIYLNTTDGTSNATINLNVTNESDTSNATIALTASNEANTTTITLDNLITLQNSAQNLGNLIQALITAIKEITITNSIISQQSKDALSAVATNFAALLKGTE